MTVVKECPAQGSRQMWEPLPRRAGFAWLLFRDEVGEEQTRQLQLPGGDLPEGAAHLQQLTGQWGPGVPIITSSSRMCHAGTSAESRLQLGRGSFSVTGGNGPAAGSHSTYWFSPFTALIHFKWMRSYVGCFICYWNQEQRAAINNKIQQHKSALSSPHWSDLHHLQSSLKIKGKDEGALKCDDGNRSICGRQ